MKKKILSTILSLIIVQAALGADLIDQAGFKFKKPGKVERLVILFPQSFGLAYILGLGNQIVGMPLRRIGLEKQHDSLFMRTLSPNLGNAIDVGNPGQPNTETILALKPDLVFSAIHVPASQKLNELLRQNGISVLGLKAGFGTIDDWLKAVAIAGKASNQEIAANKYIERFQQNLKFVQERLIKATYKPKVLVINSGDGQTTIRGSRTRFVFELIETAGGRTIEQVEKADASATNLEVILRFDPDVVIIDSLKHIANWDWWPNLRASKNNRVYVIPVDDPAVPLTGWVNNMYAPTAILWIAKCIHPELFEDLDITKEHEKFCTETFGATFKR